MASANTVSANQRISDIQNEPCKMLLPIEGYEDLPLLPLDMSVESLQNIIPNVARNAWIAKERTDEKPSDDLTQEESASIHLYTMEWKPSNQSLYLNLNTALRAQDRDLLVPYFGYLKLILSGLWKLQSVKKTVWRGVRADLSSQYPVGKTFVWWGFSSCTESLTLLESEKFLGNTGTRTLFNIECESGKEIHRHSYFQEENEILLLPATQFQVLGKINPAPGFYIIHLKETKPPFPLLQPPFSHSTTSVKSVIMNANHESNNKTSFKADLSHTVSTKSSQAVTTTPQHSVLNSAKSYHNQKLETLIQQKATLEFAEFRERQLNDEDAHLIADELGRNTLWKMLSLVQNNIGAVGAASLSNALELNSTLEIIRLQNNQLGDVGITYLTSALKVNKTLKELVLNNNKLSGTGAVQLASVLQVNKSLIYLALSYNEIDDSGMAALAAALKWDATLKYLQLSRNKITDRSVDAIVDALLQTTTLQFLHLEDNQLTADAKIKLNRVAKQCKTSVYLS